MEIKLEVKVDSEFVKEQLEKQFKEHNLGSCEFTDKEIEEYCFQLSDSFEDKLVELITDTHYSMKEYFEANEEFYKELDKKLEK